MMVEAVERRFGLVDCPPNAVEWLSDNGSCYFARETLRFASSLGMLPRTTPLQCPLGAYTDLPLPFAQHLQPRAVHDEMQRLRAPNRTA